MVWRFVLPPLPPLTVSTLPLPLLCLLPSISCFLQPAWFLMAGGDRSFKLALKEMNAVEPFFSVVPSIITLEVPWSVHKLALLYIHPFLIPFGVPPIFLFSPLLIHSLHPPSPSPFLSLPPLPLYSCRPIPMCTVVL